MLYHLTAPAVLLGIAVGLVAGLYAHAVAQTLVAVATKDPTPRRGGYLTPKPAQLTDVYSVIAMVIVGYGWALPVPLNDRWRARRWHVAAALAAGPVALAVLALGFLALTKLSISGTIDETTTSGAFTPVLLLWAAYTLCALAVVSLIPLPPTSAGRALFLLGGQSIGWQKARYQLEERNIGLAVLLALLLLPVLIGLPSIVGQLAPELLRGLGAIVGL